MTDPAENSETGEPLEHPLTYLQASNSDWNLITSRKRYEELTDRDLSARTAAKLRERGEFDPGKPGHRLVAEAQPLTADEHLELMAHGEFLARYYRHPAMLDHAAKAGASWKQIGEARGTSADQARADYREWADSQHDMRAGTGVWSGKGPQPFGLTDDQYAAALARLSADPGWEAAKAADPAGWAMAEALDTQGGRDSTHYRDAAGAWRYPGHVEPGAGIGQARLHDAGLAEREAGQ